MLNFNFSEKSVRLFSPSDLRIVFQKKCFSCYIILTDQISLSDCLNFLRYWEIFVLQLFVNQAVTS